VPPCAGETLTFGWEGPLTVDGEEQPIAGFRHYDTPHCAVDWPAPQMGIRSDNTSLTLDFGRAEKPESG
jgi:hypothetical protein